MKITRSHLKQIIKEEITSERRPSTLGKHVPPSQHEFDQLLGRFIANKFKMLSIKDLQKYKRTNK